VAGLDNNTLLLILAAAAIFLPQLKPLWDKLRELLSKTPATPDKPDEVVVDDDADVAAWKRLHARFTLSKCQDGLKAMDAAWSHFWHKE
jgi:hypothetical protein